MSCAWLCVCCACAVRDAMSYACAGMRVRCAVACMFYAFSSHFFCVFDLHTLPRFVYAEEMERRGGRGGRREEREERGEREMEK